MLSPNNLAHVVAIVLSLCSCDRSAASLDGPGREGLDPSPSGEAPAARARSGEARADPEEARRRTEAVRRAAEELSARRITTEGYLINLIAEDEAYRVAFVRQRGADLVPEITVVLRRGDFEVLSVEGVGLSGGGESSP